MLRRWRAELIALVVAVALGVGVGLALGVGRESDEDRVREVATAYLQAFAVNDPAALCASISPVARVQLEFASRDCATSAGQAIQRVPQAERDALRNATVTVESVEEAGATVRFSPQLDGRDDMRLIKRDEQWFVNP